MKLLSARCHHGSLYIECLRYWDEWVELTWLGQTTGDVTVATFSQKEEIIFWPRRSHSMPYEMKLKGARICKVSSSVSPFWDKIRNLFNMNRSNWGTTPCSADWSLVPVFFPSICLPRHLLSYRAKACFFWPCPLLKSLTISQYLKKFEGPSGSGLLLLF